MPLYLAYLRYLHTNLVPPKHNAGKATEAQKSQNGGQAEPRTRGQDAVLVPAVQSEADKALALSRPPTSSLAEGSGSTHLYFSSNLVA